MVLHERYILRKGAIMDNSILEEEITEDDISLEKTESDIEEFLPQDAEDEAGEGEELPKTIKISNLNRGRALNSMELYKMTAMQEVMLVFVAGMFHSGKTTLEMAIYQMFLRGKNKNLQFAGSRTLMDVAERSKGLRVVSENAEAEMERTSDAIADKYFHLSIMDEKNIHYHLVFTDFAGEICSSANADKYNTLLENFVNQKYVLVLVDGEKLSGIEKSTALMECKSVISHLLKNHIITDCTDVHIVYTKNDKILASDNSNMESIIQNNNRKLQNMLGSRTGKFCVHRTAAISSNKEQIENYSGLESLLKALLDAPVEEKEQDFVEKIYADKRLPKNSFERFAWKG